MVFKTFRNITSTIIITLFCINFVACSSSSFLDQEEYLLADVNIKTDTKVNLQAPLHLSLKQKPNSKWFNISKVPLGMYCMTGNSQTKVAKWIRKLGEAPVVYDTTKTKASCESLKQIMINKGFRQAKVETRTKTKKHKLYLKYEIKCGPQSYIKQINYTSDQKEMISVMDSIQKDSKLKPGMPLDISLLEAERSSILKKLRNMGYYKINHNFITFTIDTLSDSQETYVQIELSKPQNADTLFAYEPFRIRNVEVYEDAKVGESNESTSYKDIEYFYDNKQNYIKKSTYDGLIIIRPDSLFSESKVTSTYQALNTLPAISYSNIIPTISDTSAHIDYSIFSHKSTPHGFSFEVEGTNTAGDLGAAAATTYTHRNLFNGGELFELKLRGAYEAITQLEGYNNKNYTEYSLEGKIKIPALQIPILSLFKKDNTTRFTHRSTSEFSLLYDVQKRPEFHRQLLTLSYSFNWKKNEQEKLQHRWDVLSLNYMFMPWISNTFRKNYLEGEDPRYAILRYSYEDLFIMKTGYSFVYNSNKITSNSTYQVNAWQLKGNFETAGNLLNLTRKLINAEKQANGSYKIFNIAYSQYAKADFDFVKSMLLTSQSSLAFHAAFGIAIPYGNSDALPYEKRYFSGGANSVRGWSVRGLGPGRYESKNGKADFINQTGNLKIDLSLEYRTHLFGIVNGAVFLDAGNIWNTSNVTSGDEVFKINTFYKELAVAYGLGLRFNLGYFILRLDGGMKAINPAKQNRKDHYPIFSPKFSRDFTFHFAVGLPY